MNTNDRAAKRRPRRIAADEAHAWARNLRLGNHHAKMVLTSLTLYVDGDGYCFVGIPSLAEDCELSADTVRRRLVWLEEIGAIARVSQWVDENGRRNGEGRGKRTSDLIRLLVDDADTSLIEARARGESLDDQGVDTDAISPSSQQGLNAGEIPVSPAPALAQPLQSGEGLISFNPEPESPLKVPSGDEREPDSIGSEEPEHFAPAWSAWRGHEVMRRDLALAEFRMLSPDKQLHCRSAVPLFNALQDRLGRTRVMNFHLWVRTRGFEEFPNATAAATAAPSSSIDANSAAGRAVTALYRMARVPLFESRGHVVYPLEVTPQVLAFADAAPHTTWPWIEDRQQIAAWAAFVAAHVHRQGQLLQTRGVGDAQRSGIHAPWPWPPRKDGSLSAEDKTGDAA